MVEKVIRVQNVGKFADYACSGNVTMNRLTLVYAENGRGKTTLSAILRSLQTGESRYVEERRTLAGSGDPAIELLVDGQTIAYRNGAWNSTRTGMMIFDPVFVTQNVYAGDDVEHEQRRNLHRFALGEEGVRLAQQLEDLVQAIRARNVEIVEARTRIERHIRGTMDVETFVRLVHIESLDDVIAGRRRELEGLRQRDAIQQRSILSDVSLSDIDSDGLSQLLGTTLPDVAAGAEQRIREHMTACMDARGEAWLSQGMGYIASDCCPFCGQSLTGIELIRTYQSFFGEAYAGMKRNLSLGFEQVVGTLSESNLLSIQRSINQNETLTEFWRQHVEASFPTFDFDALRSAWMGIRDVIQHYVGAKQAAPLEPMVFGTDFDSALRAYHEVRDTLASYNQSIRRVNSAIESKRRDVGTANVAAGELEVVRLENVKIRHEMEIAALCDEYQRLQQEKTQLEARKDSARERLQEQTRGLLVRYQTTINMYLQRFGTDFSIVETAEHFYGQNPRIDYRISINGVAVDLTPADSTTAAPSFRNTLSSGDRTTLSLAFFLARLDADSELARKVIVFDDPLSSLDRHRRAQTRQEILRLAGSAEQVIVFSHDPYFLRLVWDGCDRGAVTTLAITRVGNDSSIVTWDVEQETRGEYFDHYFAMAEYLEHGLRGNLRNVARCIRPLLEGNLRIRFPGEFGANYSLGDMIHDVEHAPSGGRLSALNEVLSELRDIHEYSKRYHHGPDRNADQESISDNELRVYVERTLNVIGGIFAIRRAA